MTKSSFVRKFADFATTWLARLRKGRTIKLGRGVVKVNIGCGLSVAEGWVNVDASLNAFFSKWPRGIRRIVYRFSGCQSSFSEKEYCDVLEKHRFIHHNIEYGLPFTDGSVDFIYCSHLLGLLNQDDARRLLREAHRVLKKGGIIRICVLDLAHVISLFHTGRKEEALRYCFGATQLLGRRRYLYDYESLAAVLGGAGFADIGKCHYRRGRVPDINKLDNKPHQTLYAEARKP